MVAAEANSNVRFEPEEVPPHQIAVGLGVQAGVITLPAIVIGVVIVVREAGASDSYLAWAAFAVLLVSGFTTLIQAVRFGVMNIMLVSVTERTREIGIRRAVGATTRDIVMQFVAEALMLSIFGGIVGIAIGIGASLAVNGRELGGQEMVALIQSWSIAAAFLVAAGVGFASGSYPAYRATAIDPVAALRNE